MLVAASTNCFRELSLAEALSRLVDLEYSYVEIVLDEAGNQLKPSDVAEDLEAAIAICRNTRRLDIVAFTVESDLVGEAYYEQFAAICRLAKATKVVTITVPAAEQGTPFNEEVERLRRLVDLATLEGARVSIRSQQGRLSEDPDTIGVLCNNVKGLGLAFDPSHHLMAGQPPKVFEKLIPYVYHTLLRDSDKDNLQVRIGQGEIDYGCLVGLLEKAGYDRALCVEVTEQEGIDHFAELRKMRLLLESLL